MTDISLQGLILDSWNRMALKEHKRGVTKWVQLERQKSMDHKAGTLQKLDKLIGKLNNAHPGTKASTTIISEDTSIAAKNTSSEPFGPHVPNLYSPFDKCLLQGLRALIRKQSHCAIPNIMSAIETETLACITTDINASISRTYRRHLRSPSCLEDEFSHRSGITFVEVLRQSLARVGFASTHIIGAYYRPMRNKVTGNVYGQPMVVFVTEAGDFMQYCLSEHFAIPVSSGNDIEVDDVKEDISKGGHTKSLSKSVPISGGRIKFIEVSMDF